MIAYFKQLIVYTKQYEITIYALFTDFLTGLLKAYYLLIMNKLVNKADKPEHIPYISAKYTPINTQEISLTESILFIGYE